MATAVTLSATVGIIAGTMLWLSGSGDSGYIAELDPTDGVDVTVFIDFNCPHCAEMALTNLPEWHERVFIPGHAAYRQVNYPFINGNSREAAEGAACAEEMGRLWDYTQAAFSAARQEGWVDVGAAGGTEVVECAASGGGAETVERELALGRRAGVAGTPAYFVDGRGVGGEELVEALERAAGL